tara:strand:- start:1336 stop:1962 length:627 start_codon:yes stop_codon:yes gene_type:complete
MLDMFKQGIGSLYGTLPTNMRLFAEYMAGVEKPITEKDFTAEELEFIRQQIAQQQQRNTTQEQSFRDQADILRRQVGQTSGIRVANPEKELQEVLSDLSTYDRTRGTTAINPYKRQREVVDQGYFSSLGKSFTNPEYNVATSLGKYVATDEGDGMRIQDMYDFNRKERNLPSGLAALKNMTNSPEVLMEYLANFLDRPPRPVDLYLGD